MDAKECYSSLIRQMYRANATGNGIILTSQLAERIVNHLLSIDALIAERDAALERSPKIVWASNGEAGDGQYVCSVCGCDVDDDAPHSADQCFKEASEQMDAYLSDLVQREELLEEREEFLGKLTAERDQLQAELTSCHQRWLDEMPPYKWVRGDEIGDY